VKRPRIVLSDAAVADILEQSDWYQEQSGDKLAKRWERAVTSAVLRVVETPGAGAFCNFKSTELHDVRRISLAGFTKHLLFYEFKENKDTRSPRPPWRSRLRKPVVKEYRWRQRDPQKFTGSSLCNEGTGSPFPDHSATDSHFPTAGGVRRTHWHQPELSLHHRTRQGGDWGGDPA
jgi:plasmid stabilization system protein ParE